MWRLAMYWAALSVITAAGWSLWSGITRSLNSEQRAENHDELVERMSLLRQREAGNEVER